MKSSKNWVGRQIAVLLIVLLVLPAGHAGSAMAQQAAQKGNTTTSSASATESGLPDNPEPASSQPAGQGQQPSASQVGSSQSQDNAHKPVGTAAAPYVPTMGIAASRPAGAAIAPAKQRRVRTILISLGVVAGAAIAVGSVAALSHGSPSRP